MRIIISFFIFALSLNLWAKPIQIIHTNDLHSYFIGSTPDFGGYYRVKTLIDQLKASALEQGIESIVLDAGDFGEGSHYFLTDEGHHSFKMLELLGVEAAVIGNHDYMFGGQHLADQIRKANSFTQFLGANIVHTPEMRLNGLLKPSAQFTVGGKKIEVIGLTTNQLHFMYAIRPGVILPVEAVSRGTSTEALKNGAHAIIALTHIGTNLDKKLVEADSNIDVVIGGHSHTRIEKAIMWKNKNGKEVPIVQTGAHAMAVGSLIIDIEDVSQVKVLSYKLYDADSSVAIDQEIYDYTQRIDEKTKNDLGQGRWDEVIGFSDFDLTGYNIYGRQDHKTTCWLRHLPNILKEETDSDVGFYMAAFTGKYIEKGPITYGDIIENFPHVNEFGRPGWEVMTFELLGWQLRALLTAMINLNISDNYFLMGGVVYNYYQFPAKIPYVGGRKFFTKLRVNGKKVYKKTKYKVALPYELSRMLDGMLPAAVRKYIPIDFKRGEYFLWPMTENYIKKRQRLSCQL
jgi:2',3'-cyclic-nucleotide 2'-phosphodiesterase (5'-nucleotidase family)